VKNDVFVHGVVKQQEHTADACGIDLRGDQLQAETLAMSQISALQAVTRPPCCLKPTIVPCKIIIIPLQIRGLYACTVRLAGLFCLMGRDATTEPCNDQQHTPVPRKVEGGGVVWV
jgi:hypothetical protein